MQVSPQLPDINRRFLRGILWLIVFLFLATVFSSARTVYDIFYRRAEVRYSVKQLNEHIQYQDTFQYQQYLIVVQNRGNDDAERVRISISSGRNEIARLLIQSDEDYQIYSDGLRPQTETVIELERLAPRAKVSVFLWEKSGVDNTSTSDVYVRTAFDGGIAELETVPTTLEEVENIGTTLATGMTLIWSKLKEQFVISFQGTRIETTLEKYGLYGISTVMFDNDEFRQAIVTVLMLVVAFWLLLPLRLSALATATLIGMTLWLFTDVSVHVNWVFLFAVVAFIPFAFTSSMIERLSILFVTLAVLWAVFSNIEQQDFTCMRHTTGDIAQVLFCAPVAVPAGLAFGYLVFLLYVTCVELGARREVGRPY